MAIAQASGTRIYKGATTHTDMTGEATTDSGDHKTFIINDKAKRYWDDTHAFSITDNGSPASGYTIEHVGGRIVFTADKTGHTIVVASGGYFAIDKSYLVNSVDSEYSFNEQDVTPIGDDADRTYLVGGLKGKLTLNGLHEDATWFTRGGGRYIIVDSDSGVYAAASITSGTRWEYYARLSDDKVGGMNNKDVLRDTLELVSDGPVYYRSD